MDYNVNEQVELLTQCVADLAEVIAYGTHSHIKSTADNVAMGVLQKLRPSEAEAEPAGPTELCMKPKDASKGEESLVCILGKGHKGGHAWSNRPEVEEPAPEPAASA